MSATTLAWIIIPAVVVMLGITSFIAWDIYRMNRRVIRLVAECSEREEATS